MKVSDLLSKATKGNWKITNLRGWEKTSKDERNVER
jgi:hypothetical protein